MDAITEYGCINIPIESILLKLLFQEYVSMYTI